MGKKEAIPAAHLPMSKGVGKFNAMDTYEIRRHNLQALMDRVYGVGVRGAKSAMAKRLDKQPDYISRCLYPPDKPGRKNIGEDFARQIESSYDLPKYELDVVEMRDLAKVSTGEFSKSITDAAIKNLERHMRPPNDLTLNAKLWSIDRLLEDIKTDDQFSKHALLKTMRNQIAHARPERASDNHQIQKLLYIICSAAADKVLGDAEIRILEAAVMCIHAKYEIAEAQDSISKLQKMDF
jgi:hypothetical protein